MTWLWRAEPQSFKPRSERMAWAARIIFVPGKPLRPKTFSQGIMLYFGWLAIRRESVGIVRSGLLIAAVYFVALLFVKYPWQVYFCQILAAAMTAVISGIAITYFQSHLPHHPGTATNLYSNALRIGSTGGYFLFGPIAEHLGYRFVFGICAGFAVLALGLMFVPIRSPEAEQQSLAGPRTELDYADAT
jgi:SET family sugar efflux transporter-like MFS transporter